MVEISLQAMVTDFLGRAKMSVDVASFDVAGPVIDGHVKTTNLPWVMDEGSLARDLKLRSVHLMNDLEAVARSVPVLRPTDLVTLNQGQAVPKGTIAVIAPGTGLGESFLTWNGGRYRAHSSEGGHSDFAPTDERQVRLLQYLWKRFDHVGFERNKPSDLGMGSFGTAADPYHRLMDPTASAWFIPGVFARNEAMTRKSGDPKVYKGASHGLCTTHKEQVNEDLLAFIRAL